MTWNGVVSRGKTVLKKIQFNSPVIISFALVSFAALVLGTVTGGATNRWLFSVYPSSWADPLAYFRLVGHALGHISLAHYGGNFMMILLLGPALEEKYGSKKLLWMIVVSALIEGLILALFGPKSMLVLGASGVAFMMILLSSFVNFEAGRIPLTLILVVIVFLGQEFWLGATDALGVTETHVSHLSHIVGGLCGAVFGYVLQRRRRASTTTA